MKTPSNLLYKLLSLLFPGVEGDPEPPEDEPELPEDEPELPDDDLPELPEDEPEPQARRAAPRQDNTEVVRAAMERAERMEREVEALKRASAPPSEDQRQHQEEQRQLDDPNTDPMVKWQIQANRTLRQTQQQAQNALMQAQDMQDKAAFMSKASTDPRRNKYADRVEKELQQMRSQGRNIDRDSLYAYMLGKDIIDGKLKPAAKKQSAAAAVPRGKSPGARGDVNARGSRTEHQKRAERLANMNI
jgi:hypothetical protein